MKKHLFTLLALLALTVSAWADPVTHQQQVGDFWYEFYDEYGFASLIKLPGSESYASYTGLSGDITIPGTVNDGSQDYPVTGIGYQAFVGCSDITSVTVEEGVDYISNFAFISCSNLTTATLPSTITSFGNQVFGFSGLTSVTIRATSPADISENNPFADADNLAHIYVPAASVDAYKAAWSSYASLIEEKPVWVTWNQTDVESVNLVAISEGATSSQTVKDITVTASSPASGDYATFSTSEYGNSISIHDGGTITFAPTSGKLKGISISCGGYEQHAHLAAGSGWSWNSSKYTLEWSGDAATSVVLACDGSSDGIYFGNNTSIVFTLEAEEEPAPVVTITTVTWDIDEVAAISLAPSNVDDVANSEEIDGITASLKRIASGDNCSFNNRDLWISNNSGELTFTSSVGNISGIVITSDNIYTSPYNLPAGWTYNSEATTLTWVGAASSQVKLSGSMDFNVASIEFTVVTSAAPAEPVSQGPVTWDFANDAELASLSLVEFEHYYFSYNSSYGSEHNGPKAIDLKDIVATISATADGAYASFSNNNSNSIDLENGGTLTFSTELGQFQSIVINTNSGAGRTSGDWAWSIEEHTLTWAGTPANSVVLDNVYVSDITSIVFTFVSAAPAFTADITWDATDVATISLYGSSFNTVVSNSTDIDGITPSIMKTNDGYCYFDNSKIKMQNNGELIFTSSVGDIQGIVLTFDNTESYTISDFPVGWTLNDVAGTLTWEGTAADEVSLAGNISCTVTSIEFDVDPSTAPLTPSGSNFLWLSRQLNLVELYCTGLNEVQKTNVIKNVITSLERTVVNSDYCYFQNGSIKLVDNGELTFQSIVGDFTGIVITGYPYTAPSNLPTDWTYNSTTGTLTWMGTPAEEVTLSGDIDINNISSIEFFYDPAPAPYVGTKFFGVRDQWYEITGAHTAKMPVQTINHTLDVPASVEYNDVTYYVTEIVDNAFKNNVDLPNAYIGANVARIGAHAFEGCFRMDEVTVNSTVLESIGDEAFMNCKLMSFFECHTTVPPVLGNNAFTGATYMNHIVVNQFDDIDAVENYKAAPGWSTYADKIIEIGGVATPGELFFFHNQMTTGWYAVSSGSPREAKVLQYSAEVKALYPRTLEGTLVIPEEVPYMSSSYTVTGIGANAYKDSTDINVVLIPQAVKSIESGAFLNCTGVENVYFLWDDPTTVTWADATIGAEFATAASHNTKIIVPSGKLATYQSWAPAWASCMMEGELLTVTATQDPHYQARYYRTFYDSEHDYMLPPSVWAHAGYVQGNEFILHPVAFDGQTLPRGTAVVLESETQEYRLIAVGNDAPLYTGPNDLIGTDVAIPRTSVGNNGENVYVLGKQATINAQSQVGMGMYRYTGTNLGAHKAYMILNTSNPSSAPVRFLFKHEAQATDVENVGVQSEKASCAKILRNGQLIIIKDGKEYNAQGQVVK